MFGFAAVCHWAAVESQDPARLTLASMAGIFKPAVGVAGSSDPIADCMQLRTCLDRLGWSGI